MSDTPETAILFAPLWMKNDPPTDEELHEVTKSHRRMERERDEARKVAASLRDPTGSKWLHDAFPWENDPSAGTGEAR